MLGSTSPGALICPHCAYYWIALDFRTGQMVWKKLAGTGANFDSFYTGMTIGPNGVLYHGGYGGFMTVKDKH